MLQPMLITLRRGDASWSFSVEGTAQSMVWIGFGEQVDADNAIAVAVCTETQVILQPRRTYHLVATDGTEPSAVVLTGTSTLVHVMGPGIEGRVTLHTRPVTEGMRRYRKLVFTADAQFTIGRAEHNNIVYANPFVSGEHVQMVYQAGSFYVKDRESGNGTLLNGTYLPAGQPWELKVGDVLQIVDLTMVVGRGLLSHSCPEELKIRNLPAARHVTHDTLRAQFEVTERPAAELPLFYPAPRLSRNVTSLELTVDDPPAKKEQQEQSALMAMGPSLFMGMSSVFTAGTAITQALDGGDPLRAIPSGLTALSMVGGSLIWPSISRKHKRNADQRAEERRQRRYTDYLDGVENQLLQEARDQGNILRENRLPLSEIEERAHNLSPFMMNRMATHDDFMELRVGMGDVPLDAKVKWPQHRFSLVDDPLLAKVENLAAAPPRLTDVPVAFNPVEHHVAGIVGEWPVAWQFVRGLLMQVCSYYSYQDVKVMLVASEDDRAEWEFLTSLPHFYDDAGEKRLVALSIDGMVEENALLAAELERRADLRAESVAQLGTYYLIICANKELAERSDAIHAIAELGENPGMSLLYLSESLHALPRECTYIIDLARETEHYFASQGRKDEGDGRRACMFEQSDVTGTMVDFDPDVMATPAEARAFALDLARVRLDVAAERSQMPTSVGFLETFRVGNVTHLNIAQRWAENDASRSLATPLGFDELGEHAMLNLHENIHGPHGLIAGTTGSGKSEFIITYILSMCVNYAPDEAAFVLIDYKGGGLAGAFENERYHLPHLAGTITNLDGGAIQRSLVSIQSELKRRQDMFNRARDITGESTIDIYKYISYYRQGVLKEPLPHLFVIADEFAELKQQEPEFMDELVSAARIGRSLGVHLILATQRPTGVVNDQIQANSKFKICLKVADASDSKEMIRRADAAEIKRPGQYYMLVGYNESFGGGQAAYAGSKYVEREQFEPKTDNAVDLLDGEGAVVTTLRPTVASKKSDKSELNAVLEQLIKTADALGKHAQRLWLEPLPERETYEQLAAKYGPTPTEGLTFALGEVDDPMRQRQFRRDVNLVDVGNVMFYGMQTSGVGELVASITYDLASRYSARDFWFYGIDLGAGALAQLRALPQCGGVCVAGEDERIENLFKLLEREIEARKQMVAQHRSIAAYNKRALAQGEEPLARIVVALDNLASFRERYDAAFERLVSLSLDGPMCGVCFLMTSANANTGGMKLRQNCALDVVLAMSDASDVTYILTNARHAPTPTGAGRGLINIDKEAFAFQGCSIAADPEDEPAAIATLAQRATTECAVHARPIPVLPVHVTAADMGELPKHTVPVGFSKQGVEPYFFNTTKHAYMLVVGEDADMLGSYFKGMRETFIANQASYVFVDDAGLLGISDDEHVLTTSEQAEAFVRSLPPNPLQAEYYVFTNPIKTMAGLSETGKAWLTDLWVNERTKHRVVMVAGIEAMRTKGFAEQWYLFFKQSGAGLWIGTGFGNQMIFQYGRTLPEYNQPAGPTDGYASFRGQATSVRLLEPAPRDTEEA